MIKRKKRQGQLFVISSPSGGGKTTLGEGLLKISSKLVRSVSMTTRPKRRGEVHGKDYFFVTKEEFLKIKKKKGFLESAKVFDKYYGTPKDFAAKKIKAGIDVLFLIDVQGAKQIKANSKDAVFIFLMPDSIATLRRRLKSRSTDSMAEINKRLKQAAGEMQQAKWYDYVVTNQGIEEGIQDLAAILRAERMKGVLA